MFWDGWLAGWYLCVYLYTSVMVSAHTNHTNLQSIACRYRRYLEWYIRLQLNWTDRFNIHCTHALVSGVFCRFRYAEFTSHNPQTTGDGWATNTHGANAQFDVVDQPQSTSRMLRCCCAFDSVHKHFGASDGPPPLADNDYPSADGKLRPHRLETTPSMR